MVVLKHDYQSIGKSMTRHDALLKARGIARYTGDFSLPRMLYGKILRSPLAHARITYIDYSQALKLPGVKAVITGQDLPPVKYGVFAYTRDEYPLARDKVRYIGDEVAAVAAVDEDTAQEALAMIRVDYEQLPAVLELESALAAGAPLVHEERDSNLGVTLKIDLGDVEVGFARSDLIREDTFTTEAIAHCMMEPYTVLVNYDPAGGVDVWLPNQSPFTRSKGLSNALQLPMEQVRVHNVAIGGAFGALSEMFPAEVCAAVLSRQTGRPVKIVYSREEVFTCTRQKHPFKVRIKTGVSHEGILQAKEIEIWADGGAYFSVGPISIGNPAMLYLGLYRLPHFWYRGHRVFTNKPVRGAMRGHGNQQVQFADGCQMDLLAGELGLDPIEFRRRNILHTGEKTLNGATITSSGMGECLDTVATNMAGSPAPAGGRIKTGRGIGCTSMLCGYGMGFRTAATALVRVNEDGGAVLFTGAQDNGQGNHDVLRQVAAEELGVPLDSVNIVAADSAITPQDPGAYSMTTVFVSANAVRLAAADARIQIMETAAAITGRPLVELHSRQGRIWHGQEMLMPMAHAVRALMYQGKSIVGRGYWKPEVTDVDWVSGQIEGQVTGAFTYGAVGVEVEVDTATGRATVTRVVAAHDCGFALNPQGVEGQIEGSVGFGIGQVLLEELHWDGGQLLNPDFLNYHLPTSIAVPPIKSVIVESIDPNGPYGAKEAAETINVAIIPALASAITDAIGISFRELPITPEKILKALGNQAPTEEG